MTGLIPEGKVAKTYFTPKGFMEFVKRFASYYHLVDGQLFIESMTDEEVEDIIISYSDDYQIVVLVDEE